MILVDTSIWVDHLRCGDALAFIEHHGIHGKGLGYVDIHLLAAVALTPGSDLWTRDKRLHAMALELDCAYMEGDEE